MSHAVIDLSLRAEIDGKPYPIINYAASFGMNQIPYAAIGLPVGVKYVADLPQISPAHRLMDDFVLQVPAKVFLTAKILTNEGVEPGLPDNVELQIFDGKAIGMGWDRSPNSAGVTVHLLHWLANLDYASSVSASSHPSNPGEWSYPSVYRNIGPAGANPAVGNQPGWVPFIPPELFDQPATVIEDLWGNVLHAWLEMLARQDNIDPRLSPPQVDPEIIEAIRRLKPNKAGMPLQLDIDGGDSAAVLGSIESALTRESWASWVNNTLWGKLIGDWSPAYWFGVVPRVLDGLIVPVAGALRGGPWATITADSYSGSNIRGKIERMLRAVGMTHPVTWLTNVDGLTGGGVRRDLCGFFQPRGIDQGSILLKDMPAWLQDPLHSYLFSSAATGVQNNAVRTAVDATNDPPVAAPLDASHIAAVGASLANRFAAQWYTLEMLKNRGGEISGKLRFDIAPGSTVRVKAGKALNVPRLADGLARNLYGTVTNVSYLIDAENQKAHTVFTLTHVRNARENDIEGLTVDLPPLYKKPWLGAKLIEHPAIQPEK